MEGQEYNSQLCRRSAEDQYFRNGLEFLLDLFLLGKQDKYIPYKSTACIAKRNTPKVFTYSAGPFSLSSPAINFWRGKDAALKAEFGQLVGLALRRAGFHSPANSLSLHKLCNYRAMILRI